MVKVKVFVVTDGYGSVEHVGCDKKAAIEAAVTIGQLKNFEDWIDEVFFDDLDSNAFLDLLDETNPKTLVRDRYYDYLNDAFDDHNDMGEYNINIPIEAIDPVQFKEIPPAVVASIINIFNF